MINMREEIKNKIKDMYAAIKAKYETNLNILKWELIGILIVVLATKYLGKYFGLSNHIYNIFLIAISFIAVSLIVTIIYREIQSNRLDIFSLLIHFIIIAMLVTHIFAIIYLNPYYKNYLMYNDVSHGCTGGICGELVPLSETGDFYYFSAITLTSIGYGDIIPRGGGLRFWVFLEGVVGIFIFAALLASAINILRKDESRNDNLNLGRIYLNQNKNRIQRWWGFVIGNHDIRQLLITHDEKNKNIEDIKKISFSTFTKLNSFYNNHFPKEKGGLLNGLQLLIEVKRDLKSSIHLAEFCYYKATNSKLRNVLENIFRFVYFTQYPEKFDEFGKSDDWFSLKMEKIKEVTLISEDLKSKLFERSKHLSKYVHSLPSTFGTNIMGFNVFKENLFNEWESNFHNTIKIISKILDSINL